MAWFIILERILREVLPLILRPIWPDIMSL